MTVLPTRISLKLLITKPNWKITKKLLKSMSRLIVMCFYGKFKKTIVCQVAASSIEVPLLKYSAKDHFFRAALLQMCVDPLAGQVRPTMTPV